MKVRMMGLLAVSCAVFALSACVSPDRAPPPVWVKASVSGGSNLEQERAMADGDCLAQAYSTFKDNPLPNSGCIGNCSGSSRGGFSGGYMAGLAARQSREVGEARQRFYDSCMMSKGWHKQEVK